LNVKGVKGKHNHIHGVARHPVVVVTQGQSIGEVIAKDAMLRVDHLITRQSFQGRFRKYAIGDRKGRSGLRVDQVEANLENEAFDERKLTLEQAAAAADTVVETEVTLTDTLVDADLQDGWDG
jgi:hypothetical protein